MKKIYIILISLVALVNQANAQQDPLTSQYMFNMLTINPAYAGSREVFSLTGNYRMQWAGAGSDLPNAPRTTFATFDFPIAKKNIGLGFMGFNDRAGIFNTTGGSADFAYRIRAGRGILSFGLRARIQQFNADWTSALASAQNQGDPAFGTDFNKILFNAGFGAYYNTDRGYIGLSAPLLLQPRIGEGINQGVQARHYFLTAGFVVGLSPSVKLKPSVLVRAVQGAPLSFDGNLNIWFCDRIAVGGSYRFGDGVLGMVEVQATPRFRLGYAYDLGLTNLRSYNSGSHEVMVRYEFGVDKAKLTSPRYF